MAALFKSPSIVGFISEYLSISSCTVFAIFCIFYNIDSVCVKHLSMKVDMAPSGLLFDLRYFIPLFKH